MRLHGFLPLVFSMSLLGCDPGQPGGDTGYTAGGYAAALTDGEFNSLAPEQQYMVANKLLGTLFRGVSVDEFFDMDAGISSLQPASRTFISSVRQSLETSLSQVEVDAVDSVIDGLDAEGNPVAADAKYIFDSNRPRQLPLARIKEYPLSRDMYVHWMAWILANTIMFSPALEMESTDISDVQNMYRFLVLNLAEGADIRSIVRSNLPSLARWRVSRSAENHALEAFELYLGLFDTAQDSYRGGIACKDLYLTPENEDYLIRRTDFPNTVPQLILDSYYVTTCDDLYDAVAGHPLLLPRVTEVIINYLMSGRSSEDRLRMNTAIVASGPQTFEDIFTAIIFSREYLLNTERPRSFEESLMPLLDTLHWDPASNRSPADERIFINMVSNTSASNRLYEGAMGWDAMSLKIGRLPDVPLDGLSFANYHKALREELLMEVASYRGGNDIDGLFYDSNADAWPHIEQLSLDEFIDYLFLSVLQRKASDIEKSDLTAIYVARGHTIINSGVMQIRDGRYDDVAAISYDYISRLPELYYFKAVNQGA